MQTLIPWVGVEAEMPHFLQFPGVLLLLIHGPHFEKQELDNRAARERNDLITQAYDNVSYIVAILFSCNI